MSEEPEIVEMLHMKEIEGITELLGYLDNDLLTVILLGALMSGIRISLVIGDLKSPSLITGSSMMLKITC